MYADAFGLGKDAGQQQEQGVPAVDEGIRIVLSIGFLDCLRLIHQCVRRDFAHDARVQDVVLDPQIVSDPGRPFQFDAMALAIAEGKGHCVCRAVLLDGLDQASRGILPA
jgi:hypothetical protein